MDIQNSFDQDLIKACFNQPCTIVVTSGIGDGIIVRFSMFYMKIYEDCKSYTCTIQWYLYHNTLPYRVEQVDRNKLLGYLKSLNI